MRHPMISRRWNRPAAAARLPAGSAAELNWRNVGVAGLALAAVHALVWLLAPGVIWLVR